MLPGAPGTLQRSGVIHEEAASASKLVDPRLRLVLLNRPEELMKVAFSEPSASRRLLDLRLADRVPCAADACVAHYGWQHSLST